MLVLAVDRRPPVRRHQPHVPQVCATDLRGGAAVVMAGLVAEGKTEVSNIYHVERGYDHFEDKLRALGGKITRIEE